MLSRLPSLDQVASATDASGAVRLRPPSPTVRSNHRIVRLEQLEWQGQVVTRPPGAAPSLSPCHCGGEAGCGCSTRASARSRTAPSRQPIGLGPAPTDQTMPAAARPSLEGLALGDWLAARREALFGDAVGDVIDVGSDSARASLEETTGNRMESEHFVIPSGGGSCATHDCTDYLPTVDPQVGTFTCSDGAGTAIFREDGSCDETMRQIYWKAWCMLADNTDLLEWVTCLIYGWPYQDELVAKLIGIDMELGVPVWYGASVEIRCTTDGDKCLGDGANAVAHTWGSSITFCTGNTSPRAWRRIWENADARARDRLCVIIDCAGLLAHELCHLALPHQSHDSASGCRHRRPYRLANTLKWALVQRYPAALESPCASQWEEDGEADPRAFNQSDTNHDITRDSCELART